jgi:hypothetical protein
VIRLRRWLRLAKALAREPREPRPVRALFVVGLLPIPGPVDEVVLLLALAIVAVFYRPILRELRARR